MNSWVLGKASQKKTTQMTCGTCQKYDRWSNRWSDRIPCYHCIYLFAALLFIRLLLANDDAREITSESFNCRMSIDNVLRDSSRDGGRKGF